MAHYNEKGIWVWSEDEFRQNLTHEQRKVLKELDATENPTNKELNMEDYYASEEAYWNQVLNSRSGLEVTEKIEWVVGIIGILAILTGIGTMFYWVFTA